MTAAARRTAIAAPSADLRPFAREVLRAEAEALFKLADRLGASFNLAAESVLGCRGSVIVCGIGKAGLVGQKLAATLASTGSRSHFLHAAEAVHGDLGRIAPDDVVIVLSFSGETGEIVRLLPSLKELASTVIAITGGIDSTLARAADVTLDLGPLREAGPNGLAPSTSTTAMIALGDALSLCVSRARNFRPEDFARFHPGGSLGRRLSRAGEIMRPLAECRVARDGQTVREILVAAARPGRRTGAVMVVEASRRLTGLFTDSDLARLLEARRDGCLDRPVGEIMTRDPVVVLKNAPVREAVELLAARKISELPVVDGDGRPAGIIDITDVVGLLPRDAEAGGYLPPVRDDPITLPLARA